MIYSCAENGQIGLLWQAEIFYPGAYLLRWCQGETKCQGKNLFRWTAGLSFTQYGLAYQIFEIEDPSLTGLYRR